MELLLLFLMGTFVAAMRTAERPVPRDRTLLLAAVVVSVLLMSHRVA